MAAGKRWVTRMKAILEAAEFSLRPGMRVLDFGCASGIALRWLWEYTRSCELWGVDLSGDHIMWCQQHLSPPYEFATTSSFPHLPFEDNYFDLIYAGSVFTHIADLAEAWLLELRRIARPGGKLYLTVADGTTIDYIMKGQHTNEGLTQLLRSTDRELHFTKRAYDMFSVFRTPGGGEEGHAMTFYDIEFLRRHWGNYLTVLSVNPASDPAAHGFQTAVLLQK